MADRRLFVGFSTHEMKGRRGWTTYDLELVKRDLLNHFNTRIGERVMMPKYGTIIWDLLFEPFTNNTKEQVEADVRRVIASEPRVQLVELNASAFAHGIRIDVELKYTPWDVVQTFSVNFDRRSQEG